MLHRVNCSLIIEKCDWHLGTLCELKWQGIPQAIAYEVQILLDKNYQILRKDILFKTTTTFVKFNEDYIGKNFTIQVTAFDNKWNILCSTKYENNIIGGPAVVRKIKATCGPDCSNIELQWTLPVNILSSSFHIYEHRITNAFNIVCKYRIHVVQKDEVKSIGAWSKSVEVFKKEHAQLPKVEAVKNLSFSYTYNIISITWEEIADVKHYEVLVWDSKLTRILHQKEINDTITTVPMRSPFIYGNKIFCCVISVGINGTKSESKWANIEIIPIPPENYEKKRHLGTGGYGQVYLVHDKDNNCEVAMKVLPKRFIGNNENKAIMDEINFMSKLSHPRIVQYHGSIENEKAVHIFMEYMPGGSLRNVIDKEENNQLTEKRTIFFTRQILEGLIYLHGKPEPILHRDIKALNVLIDSNGDSKLCDFGCSKATQRHMSMGTNYNKSSPVGSTYWMSPEVIRTEGYGRLSDVWSTGCTIVEMLSGNPPWYNLEPTSAIYKIGTEKTDPELPPHVSDLARDFLGLIFVDKTQRKYPKELLQHKWLLH